MTTALTLTSGHRAGSAPTLIAAGEIDMSNAETFAAALAEALAGAGGTTLVVDLTAVEYLDSAGLAALFANADHIEVVAGPLLGPLLTVSGLADLITVR
ncbi:STAS domain-containing protein [Actinoplanes palleronii]|uniref:Anti-anti-sigma factor n=1 Tax=Actinoplanes palleronii TaxID=113570 RepID=A0ABQ4BI17_9ACTN|nr:STAS domain-containing protein [Actinoplanes palleronii]GIE70242.1 anti-anti-sigma factor [Actinoplanes palleronii]